jgi:hypothetical protein
VIFEGDVTVYSDALAAVPPGVVIEMLPVTESAATIAVTDVEETTVTEVAATPPTFTEEAPVRLAPLIVILVPTSPIAGRNEDIVGADGVTVNEAALVAIPPGVVIDTVPVVVPAATIAVMEVADRTETDVAANPLIFTDEVPVRLVPAIVTFVPTGPKSGVKEVIVGGDANTVKLAPLAAEPPEVVTPIWPLVAPAGTVAFTEVAETTVTAAAALPLKVTDAPAKFAPIIVTTVPAGPETGEKDVTIGAEAVTIKDDALVVTPPGAVTVIVPVVAPAATMAVTAVGDSPVTDVAAKP